MKHRFENEKKNSYTRNVIVSISIFVVIIACFWYALSSVSAKTSREEMQTLENAVTRSITHCYAIEGTYPESLSYLKENYGLTYDEHKFLVDYHPIGSNIMPDVTIIRKEE